MVANDAGDRVTPAAVGWNDGEVLVGSSAKQFSTRNPSSVIFRNVETLLGQGEPDDEGTNNRGPKLVSGQTGGKHYLLGPSGSQVRMSPEEAHVHMVRYLLDVAASHATADADCLKNAVICAPSRRGSEPSESSGDFRKCLERCAKEAGFRVVQVISEQAAACLAYGLGQEGPESTGEAGRRRNLCLVYRCGGTSLTVSLVDVGLSGMYRVLNSKTAGGGRVGCGDQITKLLAGYLAEEFQKKYKVDPRESKKAHQKLELSAESVKRILSTLDTANSYIESLYDGIDFSTNVTRARFENVIAKVLPSLIEPVTGLLAESEVDPSDIYKVERDHRRPRFSQMFFNLTSFSKRSCFFKVIMCGGTSKIPRLQRAVAGLFPKAEMLASLSPDEVLALGAAAQSALLQDPIKGIQIEDERVKLTAISGSICFSVDDAAPDVAQSPVAAVLIPASTPIPVRRSNHLQVADGKSSVAVKVYFRPSTSMDESVRLAEVSSQSDETF